MEVKESSGMPLGRFVLVRVKEWRFDEGH